MSEVKDATEDSAQLAKVAAEVDKADVVLFMKGSPATPQCGFSAMSSQILQLCGVSFHGVDVMADADFKESVKKYSDWPTIPQLYIKGELIGGCDIMREMFEKGELQDLLAAKGIATKKAN